MDQPATGEALILSQDDADEIATALAELTNVIWNTMTRRRILLRPPVGDSPPRIKRPPARKRELIDEIF